MATVCKQQFCSGLVATLSIIALIVSIYTLRIGTVDKRLDALEEDSDTLTTLVVDMAYTKDSVTKIEAKLERLIEKM